MRIAVDLDGVCYDFHRTYRYMLREYCGVTMPPVEEFWTGWDAQQSYGTEEDHKWMWSEGVDEGLFRYGHMITGARMGLQDLAARGHRISVVTHRPASAVVDTLDWVALYFRGIPLDGFHILSNGERKSLVAYDVIIDDKGKNVQDALSRGRRGILFSRPWNLDYNPDNASGKYIRAEGWNDVVLGVGKFDGR